MFHRRFFAALATSFLFVCSLGAGDLRFNQYYSDGMVLQRDKPQVVHGLADAGASVTVRFNGQKVSGKADDNGVWSVSLEPMPASDEGQTLTLASGGGEVAIKDVLIGDVFLVARQTALEDDMNQKAAAAYAPSAKLRAIRIQTVPAAEPQADLPNGATTGWNVVAAESASAMSVVGFELAQGLAGQVDVPIGVVDLNMGDYFPISWLSREALLETSKYFSNSYVDQMMKRFDELHELAQQGEPMPKKEPVRTDPLNYPICPAVGYNGVLHPLRGVAFKGVVLQLGNNYPYSKYTKLEREGRNLDREALNNAYVQTYDIRKVGFRMDPETTPRIPAVWRSTFGDPDLPIGLVMTPGSDLTTLARRAREMRELQRQIAEDNEAVDVIMPGMAATPMSAQPRDQKLVAQRSLKWALAQVYAREEVMATGPVFDRVETFLNTATVHFKLGTAEGLRATDEVLEGFEVAGVSGDYTPATARISGKVVEIESDTVQRVARVRFNWKENPEVELVNAAGLPALPFRSADELYAWFHRHAEDDLPIEYETPANEWTGGDVTLVNGQTKTFGYSNFAGWLGPVGVRVGPFGPNMAVRDVLVDSPAEGKLKVGDVIYSANGHMLGSEAERVMSAAITESETMQRDGKLTLGLRRGDENMEVEVTLEVMGSYSPTAPFNCPKTDKIVAEIEQWLVRRGGTGNNFLSSDTLFLLGAGNPEHQGLVRRYIYSDLIGNQPGDNNWYLGYDTMLMAEYYLATGDRNVLPAIKRYTDKIESNQIRPEDAKGLTGRIGGWYGKGRDFRMYPAMPPAAAACMLGLHLAREAGVDVDEDAYQKGLEYFRKKGAPVGQVIYGNAWRDKPEPFDPNEILNGTVGSDNGKISVAGVLFDLAGEASAAHICSLASTYSYNHTYPGHGGNFWNNFWTPLGANVHSTKAFLHFMDGHRWYRELNRMYDGSLIINENDRVGAGHGLALVVPGKRLRIIGAGRSPFSVDAPDFLKPAVEAYQERDYARSESLARALLEDGTAAKADRPIVEKLVQEARSIQQSIEADLARLERLVEAGRFHEAQLDLPQLRGVLPEGSDRLTRVEKGLKGEARANDQQLYETSQAALVAATSKRVPLEANENLQWRPLTTELDVEKGKKKGMYAMGKVPAEQASEWRLKVIEHMSQAPEGWAKPDFDASSWDSTPLPISWYLNHTALLRTTFNVEDKAQIEALRFRAWLFRQQAIEVYLNGNLVAKVNQLKKKTGNVSAILNAGAVNHLRNGENILAIKTRQNWRWGMLFMRVYNDGFGFMLDAGEAGE
ncbi:hypothetical protein DDZ13_06415 [Coraliomargarita sinensis]|uniref:PDZ domain-containing protein n=1 Tax=Coraliomargarita sinensis TaxID=2174842 RepID=A0A317ZGT8_9BACT|nr:DUF6288 domain-containing protein [Coraliomargarita sinensis]PXA04796.1 hypothetical protein DDZ13_06415 [Coraliomargarita sinensis]